MWTSLCRFRELQRAHSLFGKLAQPTRVTRPLFGGTMHLDLSRSNAQQLLYLMGARFVSELELLRQLVHPGMSVVDVGSNIGYHLLFFESRVGNNGRVICIEPSLENLVELTANIVNNGFDNVDLHAVALGAKSGEVGVRGGINSGVVDGHGAIATVPLKTLDEVVRSADFVKIDVDGYEGEVLAGGRDLLQNEMPTVLLEVHPHLLPRFGTTTAEVIGQLSSIYPELVAFDQRRNDESSTVRRVMQRYVSPLGLRRIRDLGAVIKRADHGDHEWTFWVVAARSREMLPA